MIDFSFKKLNEFDNHRAVFAVFDKNTGLEAYIAMHRGGSNSATFGGTRVWRYQNHKDAIQDVLNLSKGMSYKLAMANLPYGGAKGVIIEPQSLSPEQRNKIIAEYSQRVNWLSGRFITGPDVGIDANDLSIMSKNSSYMVGVKVDSALYTAHGVVSAMKATLKFIHGDESFEGRSVAVQGVGKVGKAIIEQLYDKAGSIYIADVNEDSLTKIKDQYPKVEIIDTTQIDRQKVDIFVPCALSHAINQDNINELRCKAVVGSANNQLESPEIGTGLHQRGIIYAPDYIVNAGGVIAVVDEHENEDQSAERILAKVSEIGQTISLVLEKSHQSNEPPSKTADDIAKERVNAVE